MVGAQTKSTLGDPSISRRLARLVRHASLGLVLDVDGTLIPHASSPAEAWMDDAGRSLLAELATLLDNRVAIVSGRRREELDAMMGAVPGLFLLAEHGAWRRPFDSVWEAAPLDGAPPDEVEARLRSIAATHAGAMVEHKRRSTAIHYVLVAADEQAALVIESTAAIAEWVAQHPEYELLEGSHVLEARHRGANKGAAVDWLRGQLPASCRLIVIGDDVTDEDAFARTTPEEIAIRVGRPDRPTRATTLLPDVAAVHGFLRQLIRARRTGDAAVSIVDAAPWSRPRTELLVISNRLPHVASEGDADDSRKRSVGGLVSGLAPALAEHGGVWLGWSGAHAADPATLIVRDDVTPVLAAFDLDPDLHERFYNGFANRALWPIFHCLTGRAHCEDEDWRAYVRANERYADHAAQLAAPTATVWAHDYHLLLVGAALRRRGHHGPLGHFLHVPFPPLDLLETLPWAAEIVRAMLEFDLLGFHTTRYVENFVRCACALAGATATATGVTIGGRDVRVGAFPLGIDAAAFHVDASEPPDARIEALLTVLGGRKLVLGVDRLDYSKGIVERLDAFDRFLETWPEWRTKVSLVQVAVPSRADVPEYAAQRAAIESRVGAINGRWGETHWVPVRYVYRSYGRDELTRLYRAADVGLITPLRDGMNLVAKEYVASQDPASPGVLVLSQFAGAAEELRAAVLTNPYDRTGVARALLLALEMPLDERRVRHKALFAAVERNAPAVWASRFLAELERRAVSA